MNLSTADTQSLLTLMVSGVEVVLHGGGTVTLDMGTANQYEGKGECESVVLFDDARSSSIKIPGAGGVSGHPF